MGHIYGGAFADGELLGSLWGRQHQTPDSDWSQAFYCD